MGVRRQRACYTTPTVTKRFSKKAVSLYREDLAAQNKTLLYSKMRSIATGKIKLPIPLKALGCELHAFTVTLDGHLKYYFSI